MRQNIFSWLVSLAAIMGGGLEEAKAGNDGNADPQQSVYEPCDFEYVRMIAESTAARPYRDVGQGVDIYQTSPTAPPRPIRSGGDCPAWPNERGQLRVEAMADEAPDSTATPGSKRPTGNDSWHASNHSTISRERHRLAGLHVKWMAENHRKSPVRLLQLDGERICYGQSTTAACWPLAIELSFDKPQELPRWTRMWVESPQRNARQVCVWALADSPDVVGAYEFVVTPGTKTTIEVRAQFYLRHGLEKLTLAPIAAFNALPWDTTKRADRERASLVIYPGTERAKVHQWPYPDVQRIRSWQVHRFNGFLEGMHDPSATEDSTSALCEAHPANNWQIAERAGNKRRMEMRNSPTDERPVAHIEAYWVPQEPAEEGPLPLMKYRITLGDLEEDDQRAVAARGDG